ncbi:response regulator [bacterium]|nr:response regulator [bacterium]
MPIKRRLMILTLLCNCLGLVVAGSIFVLYARHSSHEHLLRELTTTAGIIAASVLVLVSGLALVVSSRLQRVISGPLDSLATLNTTPESTARHAEAELRWKSAFLEAQTESSLNGILVVSPQGLRLHQNRRMVEIWHAPQEVLDDHHDEALLRYAVSITHDPDQFLAKVNYLYAHPLEHSTDEVELQDGRFLERYSAPVLGKDGTHYGRIWSFRDISARKGAEAETARLHRLLVEMSHQAGMSEVATSVLHNVGNVLNSVNISCTVIADRVRKSRIGSVAKAAELLRQHQADLAHFLTHDPHGSKLPDYLGKLAARLSQEQLAILSEVQRLDQNIEHIKHIVAVQQNYTKNLGAMGESLQLEALVEDALRMSHADLQGLGIEVIRDFCKLPPLTLEKHLVLQILVNLVRNAKHALVDGQLPGKRMIVGIARHAEHVSVSVHDNGIGIAPENLTRIFAHGFTTKKNGHGFGLHSGILAAQKMGGRLTAHSDGRERAPPSPSNFRCPWRFTTLQAARLWLPLFLNMESTPAIPPNPYPPPRLDLKTLHRILVVDDNRAIHEDFRKILELDTVGAHFDAVDAAFFGKPTPEPAHSGFALDFASQGPEALAMVIEANRQKKPYSLVFMDVRMPPGWDGVETTARLWEVDPNLQVVICTAYSDYSWEKMVARLGKSDRLLILKKPFDSIEVFQIAHALTTKWTFLHAAHLNTETLARAVKEATHELELEMVVRQRSEDALKFTQFTVDQASDATYWVGPDARLTYFNAAAGESLGYSAEELRAITMPDLVPELREPGWPFFWECLRGELHRSFETYHLTKDGCRIPIELTVNYFKVGGREFMCASARDITRRKRILVELAEARDAALESSRHKSQFLANMSHEIRTPMNGVIGMGELLLHTHLNREQREYVDAILTSAEHLLGIINNILDSSKIDSGELTFESAPFDLGEIVESTLDVVAPTARSKGLELAGCLPPDDCNSLRGDAGRLKQVLTNLLGNAVKFTSSGEVTLTISPLEQTPRDVLLQFSIRDTGIGIDAASQLRIFDPFQQADNSNTRKYGGTGLGLSICRQLIVGMGGEIGVHSEPDAGSEFWFTLRLEKVETALPPPPAAGRAGLRILVVDDNATHRSILQLQLTHLQLRPTAVASGSEALDFLHAAVAAGDPVPLAILDLRMPGMDGLTLAKRIKSEPAIAGTRLIMLSSLGEPLTARELREAGVEQHIVKPVKQSRLRHSLEIMFGVRSPEVAAPSPAAAAPGPRHAARILLAEDNPVNQKVALLQLKRLGYTADLAVNGMQALASLERVPYDIILMDCQMPVMDGYTATRRIREIYPRPIRIIAMTANAMAGDREKCLAAGMDDYLAKPVRPFELERVLSEWHFPPTPGTAATETGPPVNIILLIEIAGAETGMLQRIATDYLEQADECLSLIGLAIEKRDPREIQRLAQNLGSASASCGMVALIDPLAQLEHLDEPFQPTLAKSLQQQAFHSLQRVRRYLTTYHQPA